MGQSIDDIELLERVHAEKTGALYAAAGALGAIAAGAAPDAVAELQAYGLDFGVAFQHADDVLDDEQTVLRAAASERLAQLRESCQARAARYGDAGRALAAIADWVLARGRSG